MLCEVVGKHHLGARMTVKLHVEDEISLNVMGTVRVSLLFEHSLQPQRQSLVGSGHGL